MENKVFDHVMLDLETMGNKSNSAIVSIGAVEFDIETGETGREFYKVVDLQSCLDAGLIVNGSTVMWWLQQDKAARELVLQESMEIALVLFHLDRWFSECIQGFKIWGNGARFDIGILEDAYVKAGYKEMPWGFRGERDLRTLVAFAPEIKTLVVDEWTKKGAVIHDPIVDCKIQIDYATRIWNRMMKPKEVKG